VERVETNGPADLGGILPEDRLVAANGVLLDGPEHLVYFGGCVELFNMGDTNASPDTRRIALELQALKQPSATPLPPTRFQVGERVQCNMGLKDGTYSWLAGIVEAIDVSKCLDGTVRKQYKYQVKLDDRTIGCAFAPEDTEYCIRAEGGTPASPEKPALPGSPLPPPTPPSAFGSFRFGVGDSVACLLRADDHRTPAWFPGVVTHVDGWTQGRYYVYLVQLDDGRIAYVPEDSDACCVSKTPKVVVTALGTFSTTHENAVARDALELVQKLLLNVIKNPDEPKYRIVKLANQKLQTKLFCLSGGIELMQSLGFEKHANEELELPRFKPIATLTRCHVAVQDALDLLARRAAPVRRGIEEAEEGSWDVAHALGGRDGGGDRGGDGGGEGEGGECGESCGDCGGDGGGDGGGAAGPTNAFEAGSFTFAPRLQRMVLPALDAAVQGLRDEERAAVAEVRERVGQDRLPLLSLLQVEPLEMQSSHLSFQEYFAARASTASLRGRRRRGNGRRFGPTRSRSAARWATPLARG
jgi:hypothetical protein